MDDFNTLANTDAARDALARLRAATQSEAGPMELHCLRCRYIAAKIAERRGCSIDEELLTIAAILHDIGLYPLASTRGVYTSDGARLARELLDAHGWEPERIERCANAIDRHHDLRSQLRWGAEAEALRLADRVELSAGVLRAGVDRGWLHDLRAEFPPAGSLRSWRGRSHVHCVNGP